MQAFRPNIKIKKRMLSEDEICLSVIRSKAIPFGSIVNYHNHLHQVFVVTKTVLSNFPSTSYPFLCSL